MISAGYGLTPTVVPGRRLHLGSRGCAPGYPSECPELYPATDRAVDPRWLRAVCDRERPPDEGTRRLRTAGEGGRIALPPRAYRLMRRAATN